MNDEKQAFFDSIEKEHKLLFAQETGVHGTSMLRADLNPEGEVANWTKFVMFLEEYSRQLQLESTLRARIGK